MPAITLNEIAGWVKGQIVGDHSLLIHNALPLQDASPNCLTLVDNAKYADRLERSPAVAAVVPKDFPMGAKTLLIVDKPHAAFEVIVEKLRSQSASKIAGVHPAAYVDPTARIGSGTVIQPGASVAENVTIGQRCTIYSGVNIMAGCHVGDDCTLYPNVTLYPATTLEHRVLIHAGATLGAFGFGYRLVAGRHERTAQLGWVQVESDVEIGAGTTIDRGTFGATRIGSGTKIDNQVQVGHNCHIGKHNLICAQVGIAGSSSTGDYVVIAGQVGVKDHLHIADRVTIGAQSGVIQDISAGEVILGSPAMPHKQTMQQVAALTRLPDMRRQLRDLQQQVAELSLQVHCESVTEPRKAA